MTAIVLRQALGRMARALGMRGESTAAALAVSGSSKGSLGALPTYEDPIMQPYYEKLAKLQVIPATSPKESSPSETEGELAMFRVHNSSLPASIIEGHMIKAQVMEVGRRTVILDTGLGPARVARSDLPPDCVVGTTMNTTVVPRRQGDLREGDVVHVFMESVGTVEGDFMVSGVQAAAVRRMAAVWNELEERYKRGELVKGRILNAVYRGYSVGVAGTVAFLPAKQCSRPTARRIGQLQKFRILEIDRSKSHIIVADPNLHYIGAGGQGTPKRPRSVEEAQRRLELARVAEELRSILALRRDGSSSNRSSSGLTEPRSRNDPAENPPSES